MMKFLVLFCALAAVSLSQSPTTITQNFAFSGTDGVSEPMYMYIPFNYSGTVNITINSPQTDIMLCLHWAVPVVAPYGVEDLGKIWESTCTSYQSVPALLPFSQDDVSLRSGDYFVTAGLNIEDMDSTGIIDTSAYDFTATYTYFQCEGNVFGANCGSAFSELTYDEGDFLNSLTLNTVPQYYTLSTYFERLESDDTDGPFASETEFMFSTLDDQSEATFYMSYRLMGNPEEIDDGMECKTSTTCTIPNPPFTSTPGYTWGISIRASEEISANVNITMKFCGEGKIGSECKDKYVTLDTEVGEVKKFAEPTIFVFDSSVSVAVGGLDAYTQELIAPDVNVQIDAEPYENSKDNVLLSKGAEANVAIIQFSNDQMNSTKIVLSIKPNKSFGIWKVDDSTFCPEGCANHGTCSSQEYVCVCEDDYEDLDCGREVKDFTIEYIILIAVGSILILSIVIGVPIYCYLNRKQEYDIVA